jgi:probable F420-dependent oxidoreductase
MKFGFILPNNWGLPNPADVIALAVEAEERGIDSVWVNHHILNIGYIADRLDDRPYYDALTVLTYVAARTERVQLGTSVLVLPYLHPMALAKALATIDQLSQGRVVAGLGVGGLPEENEALGVLYEGRGPWSDEFIEVMHELWSPGSAHYAGSHFRMDGLVAAPKPVAASGQVEVWIGGGGAAARQRAARYGQGWHPLANLANFAPRVPKMVAALEAEGRSRGSLIIAPRVEIADLADGAAVVAWRQAGADQLIVNVGTRNLDDLRAGLAHVAALREGSQP